MLAFVVVFQFGLVELDVGVCSCVSVWFGSVVVESLDGWMVELDVGVWMVDG